VNVTVSFSEQLPARIFGN